MMRISLLDTATLSDTFSHALMKAFYSGRKEVLTEAREPGSSRGYDTAGAMNDLLQTLDQAGFDIVSKADAKPATPIGNKLPDGSLIHGHFSGDNTPEPGANIVLTPEGERIIQAVAAGDYSGISDRDAAAIVFGTPAMYARRSIAEQEQRAVDLGLTPEDFTGEVRPEQPAVNPVTEALREKLAEALPGMPVFVHTRRPFTDEDTPAVTVQPGKADAAPSPWVLREVIPGRLNARPIDDTGDWHRLIIEASATAVVTREDGSGRRVLKATGWHKCEENDFDGDARDLLDEILMKANSLAVAFIKASSPADTEQAA